MLSYISDSTSYLGSIEGGSDSLDLAVTPRPEVPETSELCPNIEGVSNSLGLAVTPRLKCQRLLNCVHP